jgi:hypothetical protein
MEVELQDAFKAFADGAINRLREELKRANVNFASISRNDPPTLKDADKIEVDVKGVPINDSGAFRKVANEALFE